MKTKQLDKATKGGFIMSQTFCCKCGGVKKCVVKGRSVPEKLWMNYGMSCDVGCICKNPNLITKKIRYEY